MTNSKYYIEKNGQPTYTPQISDSVYRVQAPADTLLALPVPADKSLAIISATNNFYVGKESFELPTTAVFTQGAGELNKPSVPLKNGNSDENIETLYFRVPVACAITVSFFEDSIRPNQLNT
jgi:hypothetical protein